LSGLSGRGISILKRSGKSSSIILYSYCLSMEKGGESPRLYSLQTG
jgi:hypothetical protein